MCVLCVCGCVWGCVCVWLGCQNVVVSFGTMIVVGLVVGLGYWLLGDVGQVVMSYHTGMCFCAFCTTVSMCVCVCAQYVTSDG